jgi:hypothetical protein
MHVKQPEFLEQVQISGGGQFDLAEMLHNAEARRWQQSYLSPDLVKANIVRRLRASIEGVEPTKRPKAWSKRLQTYVDQLKTKGNLAMLSFPGPLDEFSKATSKRSKLDSEAFRMLLKLLEAGNPYGGIDCFFVFSAIAQPPTKKQSIRLKKAVIGAWGRLEPDQKNRARKALLSAACNWRMVEFADDMLSTFVEEHRLQPSLNVVEVFETVTAVAMVADSSIEQATRIKEGLHKFVYSRPSKELAVRLRQAMDVVLNLKPNLALPLLNLRAAALLQQ